MTLASTGSDWGVLELEGTAAVIRTAARMVAGKHRNTQVGALAEVDDLEQEARILLATRLSERARELHERGQLDLLRHELYRDLDDKVRGRSERAKSVAYYRSDTPEVM